MLRARAGSSAISLVRHLLGFLIFSVFSTIGMTFALFLLPWRGLRIRMGNVLAKPMSRLVLWVSGIRIEGDRSAIDAHKPAIYVANHSSNADPWVAMILCPVGGCGVAKREILRIPFFGQAYWLLGHLLLDRADSRKAVAGMKHLADLVKKHDLSVWIWLEGTQSRDGRLLSFKRGFVHIAIATGLPVVPVITHDAHVRWPARSTTIVPGPMRVEVLDPIDTSGWAVETAKAHAAQVHGLFVARMAEHQRPVP
jgi:lysophosphatidate acyltransferase